MSGLLQRRSFRWGAGGFVIVVLVLFAGRMGQVYLESQMQGARGPYLQMPAPDGMTVRWQTEYPEKGVVRYGLEADNLDRQVAGKTGLIHRLRIGGLKPDTRYYYSVAETVYEFHTAPLPGAGRPVRLWAQGDPGLAIPTTMQGRDAVLQWSEAHPRGSLPLIDLWLTTGDNAYRSGKDREFQQHLFEAYPRLLPSVPYLPVYGNHDARRHGFYQLFSFPANGELGGVASSSEHYFSLDYGQLHLIFLDSTDGDLDADSAMLQWLQKDLAVTQQPWLVALLHHPPYSKGSHDSDNEADSDGRMRQVRENMLPLLEQGGVDLVLSGHSHVYERSHLMACHYGRSESFKPQMNLQRDEAGEYRKPLARLPLSGTIYNVVGSSARANRGPLNHPAMAVAKSEAGSLVLDVEGTTLTARFISPTGAIIDRYQIQKGADVAVPEALCRTPE